MSSFGTSRKPTAGPSVAHEHAALVNALSQSFAADAQHRATVDRYTIRDLDDYSPSRLKWGSSQIDQGQQQSDGPSICRWRLLPQTDRDSMSLSLAAFVPQGNVVIEYPPWDQPTSHASSRVADTPVAAPKAARQSIQLDDPEEEFSRRLNVKKLLLSHRPHKLNEAQLRKNTTGREIAAAPRAATAVDCFGAQAGRCLLALLAPRPAQRDVDAVINELRRHKDAPAVVEARGQAVALLDCTGLKSMARMDAHGAPAPESSYGTGEDSVHSLIPALQGIVVVSDLPNRFHRVTRLQLDDCALFDSDVQRISGYIRNPSCTLTHLSLRRNHISPVGADLLKKAIKYNTKLLEVDLSECEWMNLEGFEPSGAEVLAIIAKRLENNRQGTSNLNPIKRLINS